MEGDFTNHLLLRSTSIGPKIGLLFRSRSETSRIWLLAQLHQPAKFPLRSISVNDPETQRQSSKRTLTAWARIYKRLIWGSRSILRFERLGVIWPSSADLWLWSFRLARFFLSFNKSNIFDSTGSLEQLEKFGPVPLSGICDRVYQVQWHWC